MSDSGRASDTGGSIRRGSSTPAPLPAGQGPPAGQRQVQVEGGTGQVPEVDLSFLHLQMELLRIDLKIHQAVQLWQQANQNRGVDAFAGQYISDAEIGALLRKPLGAGWWTGATSADGDDQSDLLTQAERRIASLGQTARKQGKTLRLAHLATAFGLDRFEQEALLTCIAPALDRRYERFYGYLQDDATRKWPSVSLVLDLLCQPGPERLLRLHQFDAEAPLFRFHLLKRASEPGVADPAVINQALRPDDALVAWLLGRFRPHGELATHATLLAMSEPDAEPWDAWVAPETLAALARVEMGGESSRKPAQAPPITVFHGRDTESQWAAARYVSAQLRRPLLRVNLAPLVASGLPAPRAVRLALRDARLAAAIPYLTGWDAVLVDGAPAPELLQEVCDHPGSVLVAGTEKWLPRGADRESRLHWFDFPSPIFGRRRQLWQVLLAEPRFAGRATPPEAEGVAGQFVLTTGQIRDAVVLARDMAAQRGTHLQEEDLFAAARTHSSPGLAKLARRIVPRYHWDDVILPAEQLTMLRELVGTVRGRPKVMEEWGIGRTLASSSGITALFSGPPGTGKTMSAEVITAALGLDLYKIDLSSIVSKYIGETEKNLEKIFLEAESSNAVLFFDEADAIFGKRSEVRDAHDRYANIEISYLLQRMESYDGVTILATNLRANLDAAFTRRLQFVVDFPFPEEEDRLRIWRQLMPVDVPRAPDLDLTTMASRYKLPGGSIRNIIVSAAFQAAANGGVITTEHLLHGARRELQKLGRLMNDAGTR